MFTQLLQLFISSSLAQVAYVPETSNNVIDSALKRSFYGISYSPQGTVLPYCGAKQEDVYLDVLRIAQLSPRVRLYGADCNTSALVLQAIQDTQVDLSVWLAVYLPVPYNQTVVDRQLDAVLAAIDTYGTKHVSGITIGNEFLLNSYGNGGELPTSAAGISARTQLLATIQAANQTIQAKNYDKVFPLSVSDAGSAITPPLCTGIDEYFANVHAWFAGVDYADAAGWVWDFFEENDIATCANATNNPIMYIGETGWPTGSSAHETNAGGAAASVAGLQSFLDTYVCTANKNGTGYFFFELLDEPWKIQFDALETTWGIFDSAGNLKNLTLPDCEVTSPTGGSAPTIQNARRVLGSSYGTGSSTGTGSGSGSGSGSSNSASTMIPQTSLLASLVTLFGIIYLLMYA